MVQVPDFGDFEESSCISGYHCVRTDVTSTTAASVPGGQTLSVSHCLPPTAHWDMTSISLVPFPDISEGRT